MTVLVVSYLDEDPEVAVQGTAEVEVVVVVLSLVILVVGQVVVAEDLQEGLLE